MFRAKPSQDKNAYIPSSVQAEMNHYMAQMPVALQRQAQGGAYMSPQAQKSMAQYMQKSLPAHLKSYITPYVHQQSVTPHLNNAMQPRVIQPRAAAPNPVRRDHSLGFGQQYTVAVPDSTQPNGPTSLAFSPQYAPTPATGAPQAPVDQTAVTGTSPSGPSGAYDFILNNNPTPGSWLTSASLKTRIILVSSGALILILVIWIGAALFSASGSASVQNFTTLAQEQAELVRISQTPASAANTQAAQNFAMTTVLTLKTDEKSFVSYLAAAGTQLSPGVLALHKNTGTDTALLAARAAGTYDQVYVATAQQELTTYAKGLKQAFNATSSLQERQMLNNAYEHVQLLLTLSQQN